MILETMNIISGIQPSGPMHIGNYFGSVMNWKNLQKDNTSYFFVADLHSMTNEYDPKQLRENVILMRSTLSALEIPHFVQSSIKEHMELQWYLSSIARIGWLNRMIQFKTKSENTESPSVGLYTYPILQAADILLYQSYHEKTFVPVGQDQIQHIQLVRDIAIRANNKFGDIFCIPEPIINENSSKIMSLYDPTKKMSKSDPDDFTRINLTDSNDTIMKKIKRATSDQYYLPDNISDLKARPAAFNLVNIMACSKDTSIEDELKALAGKGFGYLKSQLTDSLVDMITPIRNDTLYYINNGFPPKYDNTYQVRLKAQYNMILFRQIFGVEI